MSKNSFSGPDRLGGLAWQGDFRTVVGVLPPLLKLTPIFGNAFVLDARYGRVFDCRTIR